MVDGAELLIDAPMVARGRRMLEALAAAMPAGSVVTQRYRGKHRLLVLYGIGLSQRLAAMKEHRAAGGHVAIWDLGYWDRTETMRLSIDALHPTAAHLAAAPAESARATPALRDDAYADGPVLIVGIGNKSAALYGLQPLEWERRMVQRVRRHYPGRRVLWRPKGKRAVPLHGAELRHGQPIEEALVGCSLVVCRHSNVAVDACIAGVPVNCEDGAARSLYAAGSAPLPAQRADFLRRLAWFNWRPDEAGQAWPWISKVAA